MSRSEVDMSRSMSVEDLINEALKAYMSRHAPPWPEPYAWPERDLDNHLGDEDATPAEWVAYWVARAILELHEERPAEIGILARRWEKGDWTEPEENPVRILADLLLRKLRDYR